MEPSPCTLLIESFPKTPRRLKASWFGGSHNYKTKQPSFIGRYAHIKRERKCIIGFEKYKLIKNKL